MNFQAIQTGVLAYGMSGKLFHVPFITSNPRFNLRAVVERSKKQIHLDFPGVISFDAVEDLIQDPEIELVVVNTPNYTHFEFAKKAIEAGKHVLIEKPMVPTRQEAIQLFELGKKHNRKVLVYQNRRWDSDFKMLKQVVQQQSLGKLIEVHFRFDRYRAEIGSKAFKEKPFPGSGIAYDLGSHLVDQVICLFGRPDKVCKIGTKNRKGTEVEDYVTFLLTYQNGPAVFVTLNYLVASPGPGYVIHGTKGTFRKDRTDVQEDQLLQGVSPLDPIFGMEIGGEGSLTLRTENGDFEEVLLSPSPGNYSNLFDAVYAAIREGQDFPVKEEEIVEQLEILESHFWNQ